MKTKTRLDELMAFTRGKFDVERIRKDLNHYYLRNEFIVSFIIPFELNKAKITPEEIKKYLKKKCKIEFELFLDSIF